MEKRGPFLKQAMKWHAGRTIRAFAHEIDPHTVLTVSSRPTDFATLLLFLLNCSSKIDQPPYLQDTVWSN